MTFIDRRPCCDVGLRHMAALEQAVVIVMMHDGCPGFDASAGALDDLRHRARHMWVQRLRCGAVDRGLDDEWGHRRHGLPSSIGGRSWRTASWNSISAVCV